MALHTYKRLPDDHIRILKLTLGLTGAIRGSLIQTSVRSLPEYVAISPDWDEDDISARISCDDKFIYVPASVQDICLELVHRHQKAQHQKAPVIWIDAICIDGQNMKERAAHALLKKDIFQGTADSHMAWSPGSHTGSGFRRPPKAGTNAA